MSDGASRVTSRFARRQGSRGGYEKRVVGDDGTKERDFGRDDVSE